MVQDRGERVGERLDREPEGVEEPADPRGALRRRDARLDPDPCGRAQPVGDRLAVEQAAVAAGRLERVPERVPQVEGDPAAARAALALVGKDDLDLGPAGPLDQLGEDART